MDTINLEAKEVDSQEEENESWLEQERDLFYEFSYEEQMYQQDLEPDFEL